MVKKKGIKAPVFGSGIQMVVRRKNGTVKQAVAKFRDVKKGVVEEDILPILKKKRVK